jgi:hypothetical protein
MRWFRGVALASSAAIFFIGCAVQGQPFEKLPSQPRQAVIYVYRPYNYADSLLQPAVTCGDDTARIGPGGYHAYVVPAGHVVCNVETETADAVEIDAEPHAYYIKEEIGWGVLTGHPHLNPIDNDKAQDEIQTCCVQEPH